MVLTLASHTTSEVRVLLASDPEGSFRLITPRRQDIEYYLDHRDDVFLIRTKGRDDDACATDHDIRLPSGHREIPKR